MAREEELKQVSKQEQVLHQTAVNYIHELFCSFGFCTPGSQAYLTNIESTLNDKSKNEMIISLCKDIAKTLSTVKTLDKLEEEELDGVKAKKPFGVQERLIFSYFSPDHQSKLKNIRLRLQARDFNKGIPQEYNDLILQLAFISDENERFRISQERIQEREPKLQDVDVNTFLHM